MASTGRAGEDQHHWQGTGLNGVCSCSASSHPELSLEECEQGVGPEQLTQCASSSGHILCHKS